MKIAQINMVDYGSTGRLMLQIADCARGQGHDVQTFSMKWKKQGKPSKHHTYFGSYLENTMHQLIARVNGKGGYYSYFGTKQLIRRLKKMDPDIIHLHNLHNSYVHLGQLFAYFNRANKNVVWTLHDCWSFTGKCPHFVMSGCEQWKTGCAHCSVLGEYPPSKLDRTKSMWKKKKQWYGGMERLTIVTPSMWLASLVRQSFLKEKQIVVIHNGIDLNAFKPTESDFREKYRLLDKKIVLGVSFGWSDKKGLEDIIRLSNELPPNYQVVLVGVDDAARGRLPEKILAIGRTSSKEELAKIYSAADVFVNPTKEENFPTVNIESIACGTPVVTLHTGGCGEMLNHASGIVVESYEQMRAEILRVCEGGIFSKENCVQRAQHFSNEICVQNYLSLYESILKGKR